MGVVVDDGWGHVSDPPKCTTWKPWEFAGLEVSSTVLVVKADEALMFRKGILYFGARPLIVVLNGLDPEWCKSTFHRPKSPLAQSSLPA